MAVFVRKRSGYRFGVFLLAAGLALYVTGFSVSFWAYVTVNRTNSYRFGLWDSCRTLPSSSHSILYVCSTIRGSQNYHRAIQALQCVGLAALSMSLMLGLLLNFSLPRPFLLSRILEVTLVVGCAAGFSGTMIFVRQADKIMKDLQFRAPSDNPSVSLDWAFALNLSGCLVCVLAAILIGVSNRRDAATSAKDDAAIDSPVIRSTSRRPSREVKSGIANPAFDRNHVTSSRPGLRYDPDRPSRASSASSLSSANSKHRATSSRSLDKESIASLKLSQKSSIHKVPPPKVPGLQTFSSSSSVSTVV